MLVKRKLIVKSGYVLDPFSDDDRWIYRSYTKSYFSNTYGLTLPQVWNLSNGFEKDFVHKCLLCGSPVNFQKLSVGFSDYCSRSCATKSGWISGIYHYAPDDNFNSVIARAKGSYKRFLNLGNPDDICYFYLAKSTKYPDLLKYGITSDPYQRCHMFYIDYTELEIIKEGSRSDIASIEMKLKLYLNQWTEYVNECDRLKIINFVVNYKPQ